MDRNRMTSEQVCNEIEKLVKEIQDYNGASGNAAEEEWRANQQALLQLLSEYPSDIVRLGDELKKDVRTIVIAYLGWSFDGCW